MEAIEDYTIFYPDPIKLSVGEYVEVIKSEKISSDWYGWHFCKDQNGKEGWVSEEYIQINEMTGKVIKTYTAKEINCQLGEKVEIVHESFGWVWCKKTSGEEGWLPKNIFK